MKIKSIFMMCLLILVMGFSFCTNKDQKRLDGKAIQYRKTIQEAKAKAINEAKKWLELADKKDYDQAWNHSGEFFKKISSKDALEKSFSFREAFGKVKERKLKSVIYRTSLDLVPDGEYVIIRFQTCFENKNKSLETITIMKEKSGKWRILGYFFK